MYMSIDPKTSSDIWVVPMSGNAGDRKPFLFLKSPFREAYGVFSPDGRWVAYHSNESGRPEIYVRPFIPPSRPASTLASATADKSPGRSAAAAGTAAPTAAGQWQVSVAGGILPLWRSDGKELYYVNPDGAMMAASITITL
jgi:Tol biopolymer transport system component